MDPYQRPADDKQLRLWAARRWVVALLTVAAVLVVSVRYIGQWPVLPVLATIVALGGWLTYVDFTEHRLPNLGTAASALVATVGLGLYSLATGEIGDIGRASLTAAALFVLFLVAGAVAGIGMGDVKYAYTMGFVTGWVGLSQLVVAVIVMAFSAGIVAIVVVFVNRSFQGRIAYGPYMVLGLVVGLVL